MKTGKFIGTVLSAVIAAGIIALSSAELLNVPDTAITAYAEERGFIVRTDSDGDRYIAGYNGKGGDITIPDGIVWIGEKAFYGNRDITSVTIPESCCYWIDRQAFAFCPNLKSVTFTGSIGGIGEEAFYACTSLEKVTFGGNVGMQPPEGGIGSYAFAYCTSLKSVEFADPLSQVDMLGGCAFSDCIRLTSINLPSNLRSIYSDAFVNCSSLTSIEVPAATKLMGFHMFGYMYGKMTDPYIGGAYVKADGNTKMSIFYWKEENGNYSGLTGSITQKSITITAAKGSDAAKYAEANGIACNYTGEVYEPEREKLPAPANITVSTAQGKIVLKWNDVNGADGYRVYMYNEASGKYEEYKSVKTCQCTVSEIESGREYKFIIAALDLEDGEYIRGRASWTIPVQV